MSETLNENHPFTINDFNAIRLSILSPDEILKRSHGEVTRPETINYRTQKPEREGLFCEKIFGPTKNWECYCGKYKRIRYKGVICEKCGVEVTRSIVRRERMGHISLAVPVTHIWFLRSTPSRIGLLLDLPVKAIEQVVYFASYIIIEVDEDATMRFMKGQFSLNDMMAQLKQLKKMGPIGKVMEMLGLQYKIPDDIAVVSFDDTILAPHTRPPLTAVNQDKRLLGKAATEMCIDIIEGKELTKKELILKPELIIRESS